MAKQGFLTIITRPQPYAEKLAQLLNKHDFKTISKPLIDFTANAHFSSATITKNLEQFDGLIFISQQAVLFFITQLSESQKANLSNKILIAVGRATQKLLSEYGFESLLPETFDSEGILALIHELDGQSAIQKLLLVRGNKGRKLLEQKLSQSYSLHIAEVYQRIGIAQQFPPLDNNEPMAIIVTSEQLLNLSLHQIDLQETKSLQTSAKSLRQQIAFICASRRISDKAAQLGLTNCYTANSAGDEDLLEACLDWRQQHDHQHKFAVTPIEQSKTMSEQENHDNELIEALELEDDQPSNQHGDAKPKKKSLLPKLILWLIILTALGYGAYWLWQNFAASETEPTSGEIDRLVILEKTIKQQNQQIEQLLAIQSKQSNQAQQLEKEFHQQVTALQQQLITSQRKFQSLSADAATQAKDWQIAEAEYLIRQAAQKLHYSDDIGSIVALLETADQQILATGDSNFLALRRAISNDISQIKSVGSLDIDGILVKLDSAQELVPQLELASVKLDSPVIESTEEIETDPSAWQTFKNNIRNTFSDYYKIHHYEQAVKPFINPQQASLLEQNLLLNLKMAQLAALRHQQSAYDTALQEVIAWIKEFYVTNSVSNTLLEQLNLAVQAKVAIKLPTHLNSLRLIKDNHQERLQQWLQSPTLEQAPTNEAAQEELDLGQSGDINQKIQESLQRLNNEAETSEKKSNDDGAEQ